MPFWSSLTQKKPAVGIDVGHRRAKVVRLNRDKGRTSLDFCASCEISALKNFLEQNRLSGIPAACSLDDPSLKIRRIDLPKMPEGDMKDAVRWKIRDVIEGSIDDYIVRYSSIAESFGTGAKKMTVLGYAVKKSAVDETLTLLSQAGITAVFVEPAAVSLAVACETSFSPSEEWSGVIDLGATKTHMVILGNGKLCYSRPLAGIDLSLSQSDPEGFKKKLAAEVQNTIDSFVVMFGIESVKHLFLAGGGAPFPGLDDYLTKNLGIKTTLLNPFSGLDIEAGCAKEAGEHFFLYPAAMALARL